MACDLCSELGHQSEKCPWHMNEVYERLVVEGPILTHTLLSDEEIALLNLVWH